MEARGFAGWLHAAGLRNGDAVLCWAENRPEWLAAFWGCTLTGVVVAPVDFRSSAEFARRVGGILHARVALVGEDVTDAPFDGRPAGRETHASRLTVCLPGADANGRNDDSSGNLEPAVGREPTTC